MIITGECGQREPPGRGRGTNCSVALAARNAPVGPSSTLSRTCSGGRWANGWARSISLIDWPSEVRRWREPDDRQRAEQSCDRRRARATVALCICKRGRARVRPAQCQAAASDAKHWREPSAAGTGRLVGTVYAVQSREPRAARIDFLALDFATRLCLTHLQGGHDSPLSATTRNRRSIKGHRNARGPRRIAVGPGRNETG